MNYSNLLASWRRTSRPARPGRRARRGRRLWVIEGLEDRALLSVIIWANQGSTASDSDNFNAVYGTDATAARGVVRAAIAAWEGVIANFNYSNASLVPYPLFISASLNVDFQGDNGETTILSVDRSGKPTSGDIQLAANESRPYNGTTIGWYFDASPYDNGEFNQLKTRFKAGSRLPQCEGGFLFHRLARDRPRDGDRAGLFSWVDDSIPSHQPIRHVWWGRPV